MRILYHHRTQSEDAQGVHIHEMVSAFRGLGHEVEVVALVEREGATGRKTRGHSWQWIIRYAPHWIYEILGFLYNLYGYWRLCQTIRLRRPDFIYERYALHTACGIWASRRLRVPLVLEVNAPLCLEQDALGKLSFRRLARYSERWICSHSFRTVAVSAVMKHILVREGVPASKIVVMPNAIDPGRFHPGILGGTLRQRYGLEGRIVIGFVGWFRPWHGLEMLLEVMHEARLVDEGATLLLIGDGPAYPDLVRYVERHGLQAAVVFTGPVLRQDIPTHVAAMDIAVQPKATEYACPMKVFEYMAMGKCIVAPDQPNIREILQDGVTGFLFQVDSKASLRTTLMDLLRNPRKRDAAAKKAYEAVYERQFLWRSNAQKVLSLVSGAHLSPTRGEASTKV